MTSSSTSGDRTATDARGLAGAQGRRHDGLRVAAVVDDPIVPAAVARVIDRVVEVPVDLLGVEVRPDRRGSRGRLDLAALLDWADRALARPAPDALAPVDLREAHARLFAARPAIPARDGRAAVDVLLDLTADGCPPEGAGAPPLEVWSLRYGADRRRLAAADFATEYLSGAEVAVCELVAEHPSNDGAGGVRSSDHRVVYRSVSAVDRHSPARTRNEAAWKAAEFPARALSAAAGDHSAGTADHAPDLAGSPDLTGPAREPSSAALGALLLRRGLREAIRRAGAQPRWFVAVRAGWAGPGVTSGFDSRGFRPLVPPRGRFYADPFVVRGAGGTFVFVEDGPVGGGPARISVVELGPDGEQRSVRVAVERASHLSYPFVFQDGEEWYLVPEAAETRTVELLRATEFPWHWEPCRVLLGDVRAWDPTVLRHDGRYWLFVNMAAPGARPSDELWLYSAPSLTGPWRAHPANPVVSDARRARPAGRILVEDGALVRPAQDASGGYGRRIALNRIDVLTQADYRETPVGSIEPGWLPGVVRTHTYTRDRGVEAIDGLRYEPRAWRRRRRTQEDPG